MRKASLALLTLVGVAQPRNASAQAWRQYLRPEDAGFNSADLDRVRTMADSLQSGAVMIVYRGSVLAAWGDVSRKLQMHSMRKSLTSALYGTALAERRIDLSATIGQLGVRDTTALTDAERRATVRDIISARSGVYLPAAYAPADQDSTRPPRGSHPAGTFWMYNNWDFNTAELIYETQTGRSVYAAFDTLIARRIGIEDFLPTDGFTVYEPGLSSIPAHTWRMSARDLARFGQLYLQDGRWNGREIIAESWIRESTAPRSDLGKGRGYGYMWWTYDRSSYGDRYPNLNRYRAYAARGLGGHMLMVIPEAELVVVHRADTDHNRSWSEGRVLALIDAVLGAKTATASTEPILGALAPVAFASQLAALPRPAIQPMSPDEVNGLTGEYDAGLPERVTVTAFMGRPFVHVPGRGEAELLRTAENRYTIEVVPGVSIAADRAAGVVEMLRITLGGRTITARRVR
jgi:CubicO group peptidase (beta-lactamase class C family)